MRTLGPVVFALFLLVAAPAYADDLIASPGDVVSGKTLLTPSRPAIDVWGNVVYASSYRVGSITDSGIFLRDASGASSLVFGSRVLIGSERIRSVSGPDISDAGQIVCEARMYDGRPVILLWDLTTATGSVLVSRGDTVAGVVLTDVKEPTIDENGLVLFSNGFELFTIDIQSGTTARYLAMHTVIDGTRIGQGRRPDLADDGAAFFSGIGPDANGQVGTGVYALTGRLAGKDDVVDGVLLQSADYGGTATGVGPFFVGRFTSAGLTVGGLFTATDALLLPGDAVAGVDLDNVISARPNELGQIAIHAKSPFGDVILLHEIATNQDPIADAGTVSDVEATSTAGASVTLDGAGSADPDGDELSYAWTVPAESSVEFDDASSDTPTAVFPLGTTVVTLTVEDGRGGMSTDDVSVTVVDTTDPTVALELARRRTWKRHKKRVPVQVRITATDAATEAADLDVACILTHVVPSKSYKKYSWKTCRKVGSGTSETKAEVVELAYDAETEAWIGTIRLPAHRHGHAKKRVYTLIVDVTDAAGNQTTIEAEAVIPPLPKKKKKHGHCKRWW